MKNMDCKAVWDKYQKGLDFNNSIDLNECVQANENFFIGKQWEGVEANGLPTPVFNFLKRVTLFQVASVTTDNIKMQASPFDELSALPANVVNGEYTKLFEHNKISTMLREYMRNAAVDGDGCLYTYWDADMETGQDSKGGIVTEIVENTRVFFGNPRSRKVQPQPWIIISSREVLEDVQDAVKENGGDWERVKPDFDQRNMNTKFPDDGLVTVLLHLRKDRTTGKVMAYECTKDVEIRTEWDTGLKLYPITWLNWDYIQDCYHGQAMITGLIPNQIFINKLFAMSMISLMTTAYPKIIYDKTRIPKWDSRVGAAIPVRGGDVNNVAKIMDPAQISPQIAQFIQLAVEYTQTFLGATSAAMGDTRPDNTSAIIALQRAASVPSEITKQNLYQSIEDLGRIYIDFMGAYYGTRVIGVREGVPARFDFSILQNIPMTLKLDVGASAYWSEIASMQTLDNLLMQGKIELIDYLERVPDGYISKKEELIDKIRRMAQTVQNAPTAPGQSAQAGDVDDQPVTAGFGTLQRALNNSI